MKDLIIMCSIILFISLSIEYAWWLLVLVGLFFTPYILIVLVVLIMSLIGDK